MIDKTKVVIIGIALGVVLGLLIAGIVWVVAANRGDDTTATPSAPTTATEPTDAATSAAPSESPSVSFDLDQGYAETATRAAITAASWDGTATDQNRRDAYKQAGFADQLVESFKPLWQQVFDVPKVFHYANTFDNRTLISATTTGNLDAEPDLVDTTGQDPHEQYRFAVAITYKADWDQKAGSDDFHFEGKATWYVTVDQATGKAVAVEQPRDQMTELANAIDAAKSRF